MACEVFWPSLLNTKRLERFCAKWLPTNFEDLQLPFAAIASTVPGRKTVILKSGNLAEAISASCAIRVLRRPKSLNGDRLEDGGSSCVLPSVVCRQMGADFVIASDVWEWSALLSGAGVTPAHHQAARLYPRQYLFALSHTNALIKTPAPLAGYLPGSVNRLIAAGEAAAQNADFSKLSL
jgi:predicted acylesterase/phospholipase RssA